MARKGTAAIVAAAATLICGPAMAQTAFSYSGPAVPIPDGSDLSGSLPGARVGASVTASGFTRPIAKVVVRIDGTACSATVGSTTVGIDHSFVNDLEITLRSPSGDEVKIIDNTDGSGNNFCQVVLEDASAAPSIQTAVSAQAPFTGTWQPANPLATFNGGVANGTWTLFAQDFFTQDSGNIRAFTVTITEEEVPPVAVPTLSEWALILFGGLMALGGAGVAIQRRRPA